MEPLAGVRILAIEQLMAMPFGTQLLADFGADVVCVEPTGYGGDESIPWRLRTGRHKRRISVHLSDPGGQDLLRRLVPRFDVVVENYRPGVLDGYRLGYQALREVHPGLIYVSVSGYGHADIAESPYSALPAYGPIGEAMSGFTAALLAAGGSGTTGLAIGDITTSMFAVIGMLIALRSRDRDGQGRYVDVAMVDSLFAMAELAFARHVLERERPGGDTTASHYLTGVFDAADGKFIVLVLNERHFGRLARLLEAPEWVGDPRFADPATRGPAGRDLVAPRLRAWAATRPRASAVATLQGSGLAAAAILGPADIEHEAHFAARRMIRQVQRPDESVVPVPGNPIKLSGTDEISAAAEPVPIAAPGAHTREVLEAELGLAPAEIDKLMSAGVVK